MATKKVYIGSNGPYPYEDTNTFPDTTPHGIVTDGILRTSNPPSDPDDVLRQADIGAGVAPHDAEYLTLTLNPNLSNERAFTIGNGLDAIDGGANGAYTLSVDESELDHGLFSGLLDDDHTQYALLAGRAGSQTLIGGTAASDDLGLQATSHGTPSGAAVAISSAGALLSQPYVIVNEAQVVINSLGDEAIGISSSETVINEDGVDRDFRIEGSGNANLIFIDAGNDRVGIAHGSPGALLNTNADDSLTNGTNGIRVTQSGTGDATLQFNLTAAAIWSVGLDNSDSDKFKISPNSDLGTSPALTLDSSGNLTISGSITGSIDAGQIDSGTLADARIAQSNVTQHEAAIDHDALTNFVANEHIDWTNASQNFQTSGDVGINRSPSYPLDVQLGGSSISDIARFRNAFGGVSIARILFGSVANETNSGIGGRTTAADKGQLLFYVEESGSMTEQMRLHAEGYVGLRASLSTDTTPNDDTTMKKLSIQKLASPPTNAAYIAFSNNPGTDTFYLVLEEQ